MRRLVGLQAVDWSGRGDVVRLLPGKVVEVENDADADLLIERGMAELAGEDPAPAEADHAGQGSEAPAKKTTKKAAKKTTKKK